MSDKIVALTKPIDKKDYVMYAMMPVLYINFFMSPEKLAMLENLFPIHGYPLAHSLNVIGLAVMSFLFKR